MKISSMKKDFGNACASFDGEKLIVSTGVITREWLWTGKGFTTTSIMNMVSGKVWNNVNADAKCDWSLDDLINKDTNAELFAIEANVVKFDHYTSPRLEVSAEINYIGSSLKVKYIIWAYPDAPGIRTQLSILGMDGYVQPEGCEDSKAQLDFIPVNFEYSTRRAIGYYNDTQHRNKRETEIIKEEIYNGSLKDTEIYDWASILCVEASSLIKVENTVDEGICLVKESHKCVNQKGYDTGDFTCTAKGIASNGWGLRPGDILPDRFRDTWASWCIVYNGGDDERELAIKIYDRYRFPIDPERDIYIMSNTWGSTTEAADARNAAREENALREIESAYDLGIDVFQIDDGWQTPMGFAKSESPFGWRPHKEKYPEGWKNVRKLAEERGITLGLWGAWWITDEDLIENNRDGGFQYFKIDFARLDSYDKIETLINNARKVIEYSNFNVRINWDVTENHARMGYFFSRDLGNIYLENRKPNKPDPVVYNPYLVLRDAWQVSKYLNLNKFQVPVQNIKMVNPDKSNAYLHNFPYCVAITLMGAPIFFQETQFLDEDARAQIRPLLALYKQYRKEMFEGYVFPIGQKPDDASWTGFQCHLQEKNKGYLILFREIDNNECSKKIKLKFLAGKTINLVNLRNGTSNEAEIDLDGNLLFKIGSPADFIFCQYNVK